MKKMKMTMFRACPVLFLLVTLAACETAPTSPTVIEAPGVAPVATAQPYVWDSADELAAWVSNGVSTGPATISGDGTEAVIRVDIGTDSVSLHGPDLVPPVNDAQTIRLRYRWSEHDQTGGFVIATYLRPPDLSASTAIPRLFQSVTTSELRSGAWLEKTFTSTTATRPPFTVRYVLVQVNRSASTTKGVVEIDWIALTR